MKRRILLLTAALLCAAPAHADPQQARKAAHLLGYIAADYAGAVRDGKVINQAELDEQLALLGQASELAAASGALPFVRSAIGRAREIAAAHGPAASLAPLARGAAAALLSPGEVASLTPSLARGKVVFERVCASCHGSDGAAQTPQAAQLNPRPADLQDPTLAEGLSPARVALAVEFGIPGTAMVARDDLSPQERLDVAFFAVSLAFPAGELADGPALALDELVSSSNGELREALASGQVPVERIEAMVARYRREIPYTPPSATTRARALLGRARAVAAVDEGEARRLRGEAAAQLAAVADRGAAVEGLRQRLAAGEAAAGGELWAAPAPVGAPAGRRTGALAAAVAAAVAAAALLLLGKRRAQTG